MEERIKQKYGWKNPAKTKTLIAALAVAALCAAFFLSGGKVFSQGKQEDVQKPKEKKAYVETAQVSFRSTGHAVFSVGNVMSNESVVITSETAGRITGILFAEGQKVKAGQVLVRIDDSTLKAELDSAETDRTLNEAKYKRAEDLVESGAVSRQDRDIAFADWQRSEAQVRLVKAELVKTTIKAPFSGTIGLRQVSTGNYIQAGTQIVNLEDISVVKVQFSVPQTDISKIGISQTFTATTDAYPDRVFSGRIYAIDPKIDQQSRSLTVRGIIKNTGGELRPGMFAQISIETEKRENALFIPESAITQNASGKSVFIYNNGTASQTKVTTGNRTTGFVEVTAGLKAGDIIITKGQDRIKDGDKVTPAENENGSAK
ncbi:efflux RND transporter periplasmic adaptor subunit [Sphaerochaeta sp.]|uniref:efflux RND transporter periplasmic adaptor subunit n=1 Tax=Sphaerochaeta sp. TaxID=1972642 RepID=UPI003D109E11